MRLHENYLKLFILKKMEKISEENPISALQKTIKRQKLKMKSQIDQERENSLPDAFAVEDNVKKHEVNDINKQDLRDEFSDQKLQNQPFLFQGKIDLVGKPVETIMPFKGIETFETHLEFIDEHYDE